MYVVIQILQKCVRYGPACQRCWRLGIEQYLTHWPWEIQSKFQMSHFQADFNGQWLRYLLWNCPHMSVIGP